MRPATREEWLQVARADPAATFFHTPMWAEAHPDNEPQGLLAELPGGGRAVYPIVRRGGERPRSTWAGCYGGPVAERPLTAAEAAGLHRQAARSARGLVVCLNPFADPHPDDLGWIERGDRTHVIDVDAPWPELFARFGKGHKGTYRKAEREGVEVRRGDPAQGWDDYARLAASQTVGRGDEATSSYPPQLWQRLAAAAAEHTDAVRFYRAEREGRLLAAIWVFAWNGHWVLWHTTSGALARGAVNPNIKLYADVLQDAAAAGARILDWNPSGGHQGVSDMKRRFGSREVPVRRLTHVDLRTRVEGRLRRLAGR